LNERKAKAILGKCFLNVTFFKVFVSVNFRKLEKTKMETNTVEAA
jgi:hypothetical protein